MQAKFLMNQNLYKQRLLVEEREVSARVQRAMVDTREPVDEGAHDVADESATDELKEERLAEADADRTVLQEVRDALKRIDNGTFGTCVVDGGPIEEERLVAMPWTPYCLRHQKRRERTDPPRRPTL
jgi:RNA polymerase-binding transcription factor DksA